MRRSKFLFLGGIFFSIFLLVVAGLWWLLSPVEIPKKIVRIPRSSSARQISSILYENGLIKSRFFFYLYVRLSGFDKRLSFGKYFFEGQKGLLEIVDVLLSGRVYLSKVIIREGSSLAESLDQIAESGLVRRSLLDSLVFDKAFIDSLTGMELESLEGFIYPETYFFADDISGQELLTHIVKHFYRLTTGLDFTKQQELDFYQVLSLASIVDKESVIEKEKPLIASVYLNRLAVGQRLQADPTIVYFLEKQGKVRRKVFYNDLKIDSPYNTYLHKGLPPTPICSPTVSAIQAVLQPEVTDFFYFVASGGGSHVFSKTYQEHLNWIRKIRRN